MDQEQILEKVHKFLFSYFNSREYEISPITNSASDRKYFKIKFNKAFFILTFSSNIAETHTFLYFSKIFKKEGIPVPEILKVDADLDIYLQEYLGNQSLFSIINQEGENIKIKKLYEQSLDDLIKLQFNVSKKIDYSQCYDFCRFDRNIIFNDLNYFKFYFFMPLEIPYSNNKLLHEFYQIGKKIEQLSPQGFVFRDFQSRNIMIKESKPYFIDYQGGMEGNTLYDLVSLLWQAKVHLSVKLKDDLKYYYVEKVKDISHLSIDQLEEAYQYCLLIRLLQVLGAYGFRGMLQKKEHFINSIGLGLDNLKCWKGQSTIIKNYPELYKIISSLFNKDVENKINDIINKS